MKKRIIAGFVGFVLLSYGALVSATGFPFQPNQVLNAADLNNALQTAAITSGTIDSARITNSPISGNTGSFTGLTSPAALLTGGLIDNTSIGTVTPAAGTFTNLASTGTVSGTGFSSYLASPPVIGGTAPNAGTFTNLASTGTVSGTGFSSYLASPPAIGGTVANAGTFSSLTVTGTETASLINVTNGLTAAGGMLATGAFAGAYTDGTVVDYTTGVGRISVGANDILAIYSGGVGANAIGYFTNQASTNNNFVISATTLSTATSQQGINSTPTFNTSATSTGTGIESNANSSAAAYTVTSLIGFLANTNTKGAGSTVTNSVGFYAVDQTVGNNNFGYYSAVTAGANKWGFYNAGGANNSMGTGNTYVGVLANATTTNPVIFPTAPTISSGFGTGASIPFNNGTAAFEVNVGTGGTASSGVIGLPAAAHGWTCAANDETSTSAAIFMTKQTASTTTSVTLTNYANSGAAASWGVSDVLHVSCFAY